MQVNYILAKPHQHLRSGLPIDAAIKDDIRLAGKIICQLPVVGDGVADKHDAILSGHGRRERGIGCSIAVQFSEIVAINGNAGGSVFVETRESSGRDGGLLGESWNAEKCRQEQVFQSSEVVLHENGSALNSIVIVSWLSDLPLLRLSCPGGRANAPVPTRAFLSKTFPTKLCVPRHNLP